MVRLPNDPLPELRSDPDASELLVQGYEVDDVELLTELALPVGEAVVRIAIHVLPQLRKEFQLC